MAKNSKQRKLSLKKVTVATFANPAIRVAFTDGDSLLATTATGHPLTISSDLPTCRLNR